MLLVLVETCANIDRIFCGGSYFSLVRESDTLNEIGLRFIGVVKTGTKRFPMNYRSEIQLFDRGDMSRVFTKN